MRRLLSFLVGNWPLKLGAVALATALYGGVVVSENIRTWPGQVPIDVLNPPPNAAVLDVLGFVTSIRYRAALDVATELTNGSFRASVDLSTLGPQPGGAPVEVAVNVFAIDRRVQIVDYSPPAVRVRIDPVQARQFQVTVENGTVPEAFHVGRPQVAPAAVVVTGASTRVASIQSITARVPIDASGLDVDQEVGVIALDAQGNEVPGIRIEPSRVHVRISVARDLANATLPVTPTWAGAPAAGYAVMAPLSVEPVALGVTGEGPAVTRLSRLETAPIDLTGRNSSFATDVAVVAPPGITITGQAIVHVSVTIGFSQASRTFEVGLQPTGVRTDLLYDLSRPSVLVTLSGPELTVDSVDPAQLHATIAVGALDVGSHTEMVTVVPPPNLIVVAVIPNPVDIVIRVAPRSSPSPTSGESPPGSPPTSSPGP